MAQFNFKRGQLVTVTNRDGEKFQGKIKSAYINDFTFKPNYDVEYMFKGRMWIMMGIVESAITLH